MLGKMENLKVVDKDAGLDVLRVWLFDLPELAYISAIKMIEKKKQLVETKADLEVLKSSILLKVSSNFSNQGLREAEVNGIVNKYHLHYVNKVNELSSDFDKLTAQKNYYESIFKTVKDIVYYQHRQKELADQRELNKERLEAFK